MRQVFCWVLVILMPVVAVADSVTIPFGTTVFCQLDQRVTSKKKETSKGDVVRASVWKDVWVDGRLVIKAGTPVFVRVGMVKKAKIAGRKGKLELEAMNVTSVDGRDVSLDGGYDQSGRGRMGLSIALAAVVAWPLIFIKGKNAILEPGTIFDAMVRSPVVVESEPAPGKLKIQPDLVVTVLYDEMDPEKKIKDLPLELQKAQGELDQVNVVSVNGQEISPLPIRLSGVGPAGGARGLVDFKSLSKHFTQGMNRFEVRAADASVEILLEIEF